MISFTSVFLLLAALYYGSYLVRWIRHYLWARQSGFEIVLIPYDTDHPFWLVTGPILKPLFQKYLPTKIWQRIQITIGPWEHEVKRTMNVRLGAKTYLLVGPGRIEMFPADPEVVTEVLKRPRDFSQQYMSKRILSRFGPSVITSDGDSWAKQRKIVAKIVNERVSKLVWEESHRQAIFLADELAQTQKKNGSAGLAAYNGVRKIAINVLSRAGYGIPQEWNAPNIDRTKKALTGYHHDFMSSVNYNIDYLIAAALIPSYIFLNYPSWLPGSDLMRQIGYAGIEYPKHARAKIGEERELQASSGGRNVAKNSLISQLVLNSDAGPNSDKSISLTDAEMEGNLFVFTAAGFDTTASALTSALILLAAYPEWQDWAADEIARVFPTGTTDDIIDYAAIFPRAPRTLAIMLETLRLFPPVPHNAKQNWTGEFQTIHTSTKTYRVPPTTQVIPMFLYLALDPLSWRHLNDPGHPQPSAATVSETLQDALDATADEYRFRPARWITLRPDGCAPQPEHGDDEAIHKPPPGYYLPFSAGPRVCPGYKMAQVEFVGVVMTLLRRFRVGLVRKTVGAEGREETLEQAQDRVWSVMHDLKQGLSVQMKRRDEIDLRFVERAGSV